MKTLSVLLIAMMIFASAPVFACGGSCGGGDKDKDDQAFTVAADSLCGGSCGGDKDKDKDKDEDASLMCGGSCGGGKDKDKKD